MKKVLAMTKLSDEDLQFELKRRAESREREEYEGVQAKDAARCKRIASFLTREMVDTLAPFHLRYECNGCSDEKLGNAEQARNGSPHCARCTLLYALDKKEWPSNTYLSLKLEFPQDDGWHKNKQEGWGRSG